jgi:predicted phosphodiesterase
MRIAIITDIHGNLPALRAVLGAIEAEGVDRTVCLGDIVGYGAFPAECVRMIRETGMPTVMGNHDHYLTAPDDKMLAMEASRAGRTNQVYAGIRHARERVVGEDLEWLAGRPRTVVDGQLVFGHAALHEDLKEWPYLVSWEEAQGTLDILGKRIGFFGHSHRENAFCGGAEGFVTVEPGVYRFPPASRPAAITVGSVGQPRTGDARAHWAVWDTRTATLRLRRTKYPVAEAAHAILDAGLPAGAALRLFGARRVDPGVAARVMEEEG